jgi:hypothetical protein
MAALSRHHAAIRRRRPQPGHLLRGHLKKIGSRWRKLPPGKITLIVLAALRHDHRLADMAAGNGVSASTIHRWTWKISAAGRPSGELASRTHRSSRSRSVTSPLRQASARRSSLHGILHTSA